MQTIIDRFVDAEDVAIAGMSHDAAKWANTLAREIESFGYTVHGVNPKGGEVSDKTLATDPSQLPASVENLIIAVRPAYALDAAKAAMGTGVKRVWLNIGEGASGTTVREIRTLYAGDGPELVYGFCPLMFFAKGGFHVFHRKLKKFFGGYPKEYVPA